MISDSYEFKITSKRKVKEQDKTDDLTSLESGGRHLIDMYYKMSFSFSLVSLYKSLSGLSPACGRVF